MRFCSLPGLEKTARKLFGYVLSQANHPQIIQNNSGKSSPNRGENTSIFENTNQYLLSQAKPSAKIIQTTSHEKGTFERRGTVFPSHFSLMWTMGGGILSVKRWGKLQISKSIRIFNVEHIEQTSQGMMFFVWGTWFSANCPNKVSGWNRKDHQGNSKPRHSIPTESMYGTCAYISLIFMVNVWFVSTMKKVPISSMYGIFTLPFTININET